MDKGRLVEEGSHSQLIALNGLYAALVRKQILPMDEDLGEPSKKKREKAGMEIEAHPTENGTTSPTTSFMSISPSSSPRALQA